MASGSVTMTTANSQIPEGWQDDLILAARHAMVMPKLVFQDWKWDKKMGDTMHVRRMVNWDSATKVHGTDATATTFTDPGDQILVINNFTIAVATVEEVAKLFIPDAYTAEMKKGMGYALNRTVETTLTAMFQNFSQGGASIGAALGTEATWETLTNANVLLRQASVDPDVDSVALVISPNQAAAFKRSDLFVNACVAGPEGPENVHKSRLAQIKLLGCSVYESNLLRNPAAGQHDCAMFDKRGIALAFAQQPKYFEEFRALTLGTVVGFWQAFGTAEVQRYGETPGDLTPVDNFAVYIPAV